MEFVFALPDDCSVAWGTVGVWVTQGEPWFADDPFVMAHPEMFSPVPRRPRSTEGREAVQIPLSELAVATAPRPRGRANG